LSCLAEPCRLTVARLRPSLHATRHSARTLPAQSYGLVFEWFNALAGPFLHPYDAKSFRAIPQANDEPYLHDPRRRLRSRRSRLRVGRSRRLRHGTQSIRTPETRRRHAKPYGNSCCTAGRSMLQPARCREPRAGDPFCRLPPPAQSRRHRTAPHRTAPHCTTRLASTQMCHCVNTRFHAVVLTRSRQLPADLPLSLRRASGQVPRVGRTRGVASATCIICNITTVKLAQTHAVDPAGASWEKLKLSTAIGKQAADDVLTSA
jgi:hypothetical protein